MSRRATKKSHAVNKALKEYEERTGHKVDRYGGGYRIWITATKWVAISSLGLLVLLGILSR